MPQNQVMIQHDMLTDDPHRRCPFSNARMIVIGGGLIVTIAALTSVGVMTGIEIRRSAVKHIVSSNGGENGKSTTLDNKELMNDGGNQDDIGSQEASREWPLLLPMNPTQVPSLRPSLPSIMTAAPTLRPLDSPSPTSLSDSLQNSTIVQSSENSDAQNPSSQPSNNLKLISSTVPSMNESYTQSPSNHPSDSMNLFSSSGRSKFSTTPPTESIHNSMVPSSTPFPSVGIRQTQTPSQSNQPSDGLNGILSSTPTTFSTVPPTDYSRTSVAPTSSLFSERTATLTNHSSVSLWSIPPNNPSSILALSPTSSPAPTPPETTFYLRLFWKMEYMWQESADESWYCLACATCGDNFFSSKVCPLEDYCQDEMMMAIANCKPEQMTKPGRTKARQFVIPKQETPGLFYGPVLGGDQLQLNGMNLCLERTGKIDVKLKTCDANSSRQRWLGFQPHGRTMELHPLFTIPGDVDRCLTQHHHPKGGERVYAESCKLARRAYHSLWVTY